MRYYSPIEMGTPLSTGHFSDRPYQVVEKTKFSTEKRGDAAGGDCVQNDIGISKRVGDGEWVVL
jgi:hypothetical protein